MVIGIVAVLLSFFSLGLLPAIAAIIVGHIAGRREPQGRPFWLTGLITGYVALGISLIWGVFFIGAIILGMVASSS